MWVLGLCFSAPQTPLAGPRSYRLRVLLGARSRTGRRAWPCSPQPEGHLVHQAVGFHFSFLGLAAATPRRGRRMLAWGRYSWGQRCCDPSSARTNRVTHQIYMAGSLDAAPTAWWGPSGKETPPPPPPPPPRRCSRPVLMRHFCRKFCACPPSRACCVRTTACTAAVSLALAAVACALAACAWLFFRAVPRLVVWIQRRQFRRWRR